MFSGCCWSSFQLFDVVLGPFTSKALSFCPLRTKTGIIVASQKRNTKSIKNWTIGSVSGHCLSRWLSAQHVKGLPFVRAPPSKTQQGSAEGGDWFQGGFAVCSVVLPSVLYQFSGDSKACRWDFHQGSVFENLKILKTHLSVFST